MSAPVWASFLTLANQQSAQFGLPPVGFANPVIYFIGQSSDYGATFHDITSGNNGVPGYNAVPGYDLVTGWGSPRCELINELSPPSTQAEIHAALTETQFGPAICMFGTGFAPDGVVEISYVDVPGHGINTPGSFANVQHTGMFGVTDTTQTAPGAEDPSPCTPTQLSATVTVLAFDGKNLASAILPASYWCGNGGASGTVLVGGCGGRPADGCECPTGEQTCSGTCCPGGQTCVEFRARSLCVATRGRAPAVPRVVPMGSAKLAMFAAPLRCAAMGEPQVLCQCCQGGTCLNGECCLGAVANGQCCGGFGTTVCNGNCCV